MNMQNQQIMLYNSVCQAFTCTGRIYYEVTFVHVAMARQLWTESKKERIK